MFLSKTRRNILCLTLGAFAAALFLCTVQRAMAENIELYVDEITKQVFTEPGPGRRKLGVANEVLSGPAQVKLAEKPADKPAEKHWYDKMQFRGYTQFRYTSLWDKDGADWFHPADKTVAKEQSFLIRRGRLILQGDVADHLFLYIQPDFNASPSDGDSAVQLRDMYGDISFDKKKEFRLRFGQSKVPYGFVNMQSSQNRLTLERAEALNSAVETERDIGAFFYWAPEEIRARFRQLIKDGLKGSGDYGVVGIGAYNGQGPNRSDTNGELHSVARVSYPFLFDGGQFFEPGIQAYTGRFVPRTSAIQPDGVEESFSPKFHADGVRDERIAFTTVLYPQPFGLEAEWTIGRGPQLSDDFSSIDDKSLHGGYILGSYKIDSDGGTWLPFVRWQYFDGARKFARNAPQVILNEWDFGVEYQPWPEFEVVAQYSYTTERSNTNAFPYDEITSGSRLGLQAQWNY